jgi:hypothetical protein
MILQVVTGKILETLKLWPCWLGWARLAVHDKGHAITAVLAGYA